MSFQRCESSPEAAQVEDLTATFRSSSHVGKKKQLRHRSWPKHLGFTALFRKILNFASHELRTEFLERSLNVLDTATLAQARSKCQFGSFRRSMWFPQSTTIKDNHKTWLIWQLTIDQSQLNNIDFTQFLRLGSSGTSWKVGSTSGVSEVSDEPRQIPQFFPSRKNGSFLTVWPWKTENVWWEMSVVKLCFFFL